jgi:hypothetical protein
MQIRFGTILSISMLLGVLSCGQADSSSQLAEVTATETILVCKALWVCKGSSQPMGEVTSRTEYPAGAYELCRADLEEQVENIGRCQQGQDVMAESVAATSSEVMRVVLTTRSENGAKLHYLLTMLNDKLRGGCALDSCFDYWQNLGDRMNDLRDWWIFLRDENLTVSGEIAEAARELGERLCNVKHTGPQKWLDFLSEKQHIAATVARRIQLRFGISAPTYCKQ